MGLKAGVRLEFGRFIRVGSFWCAMAKNVSQAVALYCLILFHKFRISLLLQLKEVSILL